MCLAVYFGDYCEVVNKKCKCPTEFNAAVFECPCCYGNGCQECDKGQITITTCLRKQITPDVWRMLKWILRAEDRNILPVDGGGLDQTKSFMDAWDYVSPMIRAGRARLGIT